MKKILMLGCLLGYLPLVGACDPLIPPLLNFRKCDSKNPSTCDVKFSAMADPYPVSKQGDAVYIQTGRLIGDDESVEVTLTQDQSPPKTGFKVNRLVDSIDVVFFSKDLADLKEGLATLTVAIIPIQGAEPQRFTMNLKINNS